LLFAYAHQPRLDGMSIAKKACSPLDWPDTFRMLLKKNKTAKRAMLFGCNELVFYERATTNFKRSI
jgi:hypothetical protein